MIDREVFTSESTFNGNDAVALVVGGLTFDVIGQIGVDPGVAWTVGAVSTVNQTLRRACTVTGGDPDGSNAFDPSIEWTTSAVDTFTDLGIACP